MVKLMGHLGMALLWATPVWFVWNPRTSLAFIGLALSTAMVPDVDLVLEDFLGVVHHGVTHTVLFVACVALTAAAIVVYALATWVGLDWIQEHGITPSDRGLYGFVAGALAFGGLSHLFVDMLSAPDIAAPLEPFWPLYREPVSLDVIYYSSFWWNVGLLTVGVLAHLAIATVKTSVEWPYGSSQEL